MEGKAACATVSGKAWDETRPDLLYQSCGFSGWTLWHILRERETERFFKRLIDNGCRARALGAFFCIYRSPWKRTKHRVPREAASAKPRAW